MTDLSQLERSSLTTLRIIVDLMAGEVVALRSEVKRLKAEHTQNPQTTSGECSLQGDGTSGPVAWWLKGSEYDTGCEYEYVSLLKENAAAAAAEGGTVTPLYRSPTLTDEERHAVLHFAGHYGGFYGGVMHRLALRLGLYGGDT